LRRIAALLSGIVLLSNYGNERIMAEPQTDVQRPSVAAKSGSSEALAPAVQKDIATLRESTEHLRDFETARDFGGWSVMITGCMDDPVAGGMGFQYGNPKLIDDSVRVDAPELLLYEPEKNGHLRLVGVEYVVPLSEWKSATPPRLFGRDFAVNATFQIWTLHVWAWEHNPNGMFAEWNPRVTCDYTSNVSAITHR
jgi:hypothetical protein